MSFLDKAKDARDAAVTAAKEAAVKAQEFAVDHKDQVSGAIDKSGTLVNKGTKGRFAKQIETVTGKAGEAVEKLTKPE